MILPFSWMMPELPAITSSQSSVSFGPTPDVSPQPLRFLRIEPIARSGLSERKGV
jgi:hypothetical protein